MNTAHCSGAWGRLGVEGGRATGVGEAVYATLGGPSDTIRQTDGCQNECRMWSSWEPDCGGVSCGGRGGL